MSTNNSVAESATNSGAATGGNAADGGRIAAVRQTAAETYANTRERTTAAYQAARERAGTAVQGVRQTARTAGKRTAAGIETNPVAALVGGIAIGLVAGAVLPRSRREQAVLGPAGRKIHETAREAARAARETGMQQIEELGLTRDALQQRLGEFTERAVGAVKTSASAAAGTVAGSSTDGAEAGTGTSGSGGAGSAA